MAVGQLFERARVLVGTSEIEGFPNTYLQAWARGTPVVAFLDPQQLLSRNALGHAVTGLREMTVTVQRLCTQAHEWEPVSRRCRQYMNERPDAAQMLEPYLQALLSLHQAPPPASTRPLAKMSPHGSDD
jgi:hypothetical protein